VSQPLDAVVKRGAPVEKVTTFVLDRRAGVACLLLLYHPYAGIQLPAGTVEAGESAKVAALREAQEETDLEGLVWGELLGEEREELPATVASARVRYFAWVNAPGNTPDTWTNLDDQHNFTLRWHRVDALPELVAPQAPWLRYLPKQ
jgi:8-oxo-dGTP pyrophosphatase MutT (NUDIX family)